MLGFADNKPTLDFRLHHSSQKQPSQVQADRVSAGHPRKLIARLKEVGSNDAFFYEDPFG